MEDLFDNDKNIKKFLYDGDYKIDITFTKWVNNNEIKELKCEWQGIKNYLKIVKCILCNPVNDADNDYHLVLFTQMADKKTNLTEATNLKFAKNEKIQCVLVVYGTAEKMPSAKDIDCKLYEAIANGDDQYFITNNQDPLIPDTNNGSIIIKK